MQEKEHLLKLEKTALKKCPRLDILDNILLQAFKVVNNDNINKHLYNEHEQSVLNFILNAGWKTNSHLMENSKETSLQLAEQDAEKLHLFKTLEKIECLETKLLKFLGVENFFK